MDARYELEKRSEEIVDSHNLILVISIRYDKALNNAAAITSPLSFSESITDFSK